jgi:hypothetical protein
MLDSTRTGFMRQRLLVEDCPTIPLPTEGLEVVEVCDPETLRCFIDEWERVAPQRRRHVGDGVVAGLRADGPGAAA